MNDYVTIHLQRSYELLGIALSGEFELSPQPNGRLRFLLEKCDRDSILAFAREQIRSVDEGGTVQGTYGFSEFWDPTAAPPEDFWETWMYLDVVTRHATAAAIWRQVRTGERRPDAKALHRHLRGTRYLDRVSKGELDLIVADIYRLLDCGLPSRLEIHGAVKVQLERMGFACVRVGYAWKFERIASPWTGFYEVGGKGNPQQVKFHFRFRNEIEWTDILPLHLNVGIRSGVPSFFAWDQIRGDAECDWSKAAVSLVDSIDKITKAL